MGKFIDLTGSKFGRLTVIKYVGVDSNHKSSWLCECECNNHTRIITFTHNLTSGHTKSCGCLKNVIASSSKFKHGLSHSRINQIYRSMKDRCYNINNEFYKNYGGRGIKVCDEWLGEYGFTNFYNWAISHGYSESLTIDRVNNNSDYCPSNCRWATYKQQSVNRRNNHFIIINGEQKTVKEWCDFYGINTLTFYARLRKNPNLSEIEALTIPLKRRG